MNGLSGKVALITGARAGIAKAGILAELRGERGRATGKQVRDAAGDACFFEADVTRDDSVKRAIDTAVARYGRPHILTHCAGGLLAEDLPVHKMELGVFERTIALNLRYPLLCRRHGIPHMIASGGGSIINFSIWLALIGQEKPA